MVSIFFVGLAAGCAYFIFKIYRIFDPDQPADKYKNIKNFLTFFGKLNDLLACLNKDIYYGYFISERILGFDHIDHH